MSETITIRKIKIEDWKEYKQIRLSTLKNTPEAFSTKYEDSNKENDKYWINKLKDINNSYFLAEDGTKPVGVIRLTINDPEVNQDTAMIGGLFVEEKYRKQGIATRLMKRAVNEAKKYDMIKKVRLEVMEGQACAIGLYRKLGFLPVEIKSGKMNEIVMERAI